MKALNFNKNRVAVSLDNEILKLRQVFEPVPDKRARNSSHKLSDILRMGFVVFSLKMLWAFYIDPWVQYCGHISQQIEKKLNFKLKFWNSIAAVFQTVLSDSMQLFTTEFQLIFQIGNCCSYI